MSGNRLENDDVREKLAELTDEELEQVTGGSDTIIEDKALLTFNGKFLNNGSRTCKGDGRKNEMYTGT